MQGEVQRVLCAGVYSQGTLPWNMGCAGTQPQEQLTLLRGSSEERTWIWYTGKYSPTSKNLSGKWNSYWSGERDKKNPLHSLASFCLFLGAQCGVRSSHNTKNKLLKKGKIWIQQNLPLISPRGKTTSWWAGKQPRLSWFNSFISCTTHTNHPPAARGFSSGPGRSTQPQTSSCPACPGGSRGSSFHPQAGEGLHRGPGKANQRLWRLHSRNDPSILPLNKSSRKWCCWRLSSEILLSSLPFPWLAHWKPSFTNSLSHCNDPNPTAPQQEENPSLWTPLLFSGSQQFSWRWLLLELFVPPFLAPSLFTSRFPPEHGWILLRCLPAAPWLCPCTEGRTSQFHGLWESHRGAFCSSGGFVPWNPWQRCSAERRGNLPQTLQQKVMGPSLPSVELLGSIQWLLLTLSCQPLLLLTGWDQAVEGNSALSQFNNPKFQHCGNDPMSKY